MNAIITVVGKDGKGIIAAVSARCAEVGANIIEISQSVLKEYFAMNQFFGNFVMTTVFSFTE